MEISLPDLVKVNIQRLIDEICGLQKTKKELEELHIKPLTEQIDILKQKILVEWRVAKDEKKFYGTELPTGEKPHATVSVSVSESVDLEKLLFEVIKKVHAPVMVDDIPALAKFMWMTETDFRKEFVKRSESKPSVRIYEK